MLLTSVPDDIFHTIVSDTSLDKSSLRALSLANRRFAEPAQQQLVRNVDILVPFAGLTADGVSTAFTLFVLTIRERPDLARSVRAVTLKWCYGNGTHQKDQDLCFSVNHLLEKLPNIRSLSLAADELPHNPIQLGIRPQLAFQPNFLLVNPMLSIRDVRISDNRLTAADVRKYISLPSLRTLGVSLMDVQTDIPLTGLKTIGYKSTALSILILLGFHLPEQELQELLQWPRKLKTLACSIPGREQHGRKDIWHKPKMNHLLSPASLTRALEPVKHSLVNLWIEDSGTDWPGHDDSRIDLNDFSSLKSLLVLASCLFITQAPQPSRVWVHKLMPPSLEKVEVQFGFGWGLLYLSTEAWKEFEQNSQNVDFWKYAWLQEMADAKSEITNLKKITIAERTGSKWILFDTFPWTPPKRLGESFDKAGITLDIQLRKPRQGEGHQDIPWQ